MQDNPLDCPDLRHGQKVKLSFRSIPFSISIIIPNLTPFLLEISHVDPQLLVFQRQSILVLIKNTTVKRRLKKSKCENLMQ